MLYTLTADVAIIIEVIRIVTIILGMLIFFKLRDPISITILTIKNDKKIKLICYLPHYLYSLLHYLMSTFFLYTNIKAIQSTITTTAPIAMIIGVGFITTFSLFNAKTVDTIKIVIRTICIIAETRYCFAVDKFLILNLLNYRNHSFELNQPPELNQPFELSESICKYSASSGVYIPKKVSKDRVFSSFKKNRTVITNIIQFISRRPLSIAFIV